MAGPNERTTTDNNAVNAQQQLQNGAAACTEDASGAWLDEHFPLHKAIFQANNKLLAKTLREEPNIDPDARDTHGNTALHLAVMLGNLEAAKLLLAHGAQVRVKNNEGWKSLHEAISYGDRKMIAILLMAHKRQSHLALTERLPDLRDQLTRMDDFYLEVKWEFQTWIPLLSRIMPSDTFKIFKKGSRIRVDFTLIDFNERLFHWVRGDMSLLFDPDAPKGHQTILMDNQKKVYQRVRDKNRHLDDELDLLMGSDIVTSHISTRPIEFVRAKHWLLGNRTNTIGEYNAELFHIKGMSLITRKRREHLSQEDVKRNRAMQQAFTNGKMPVPETEDNSDEHRKSLPPPPRVQLTWAQYLRVPDGPLAHLGRIKCEKCNTQEVKGMLALSQDFPLTIDPLLDILQVLEPVNPTVRKVRAFCGSGRLPTGFPVQMEVPVMATLSMKVSFQHFHWRDPEDSFRPEMFEIPEDFKEDSKHFRNM